MISKFRKLLTPQQVFERAAEIIEPEVRKIVLEMVNEKESKEAKTRKKVKEESAK